MTEYVVGLDCHLNKLDKTLDYYKKGTPVCGSSDCEFLYLWHIILYIYN